jgi:hypothetical protein
MTPHTRIRLIEVLRRQHSQLVVFFRSEHRDTADLHYAAAITLRSMLCDKKWPTLLALATEGGIELPVWGPLPRSAADTPAPGMFISPLVAATTRAIGMAGEFVMPLSEYLDAPIGAITTDVVSPNAKGQWYTARKLIKGIANKEGPAHFDPKQEPLLSNLTSGMQTIDGCMVTMIGPQGIETPLAQSDNLLVRIAMIQLMQMAIEHSATVLRVCDASPKV